MYATDSDGVPMPCDCNHGTPLSRQRVGLSTLVISGYYASRPGRCRKAGPRRIRMESSSVTSPTRSTEFNRCFRIKSEILDAHVSRRLQASGVRAHLVARNS